MLNNWSYVKSLSVKDKASSLDEVFFNTKIWLYICTQSKLDRLLNQSGLEQICPVRVDYEMRVSPTIGT